MSTHSQSASSTSPRRILVTGSTGKQGGSVVRALAKLNSAKSSPRFVILAVTRNPSSGSAKALAKIPNVTLVQGDLDDPEHLFEAAKEAGKGPVDAIYSVQTSTDKGGIESEERQGKALADAAVNAGVKQVVYSSVNFGGLDKTDVPHFESKRRIEQYMLSTYPNLQLTILRPVAFMDNFNGLDTFQGRAMATVLTQQLNKGVRLQLIACSDIGHYAALAFADPDKYAGQVISLAGDELTGEEMAMQFQEVKGHPLPTTFTLVSTMVKYMLTEVRTMVAFFNSTGYSADVAKLRSENAELKTWKQWLASEHTK